MNKITNKKNLHKTEKVIVLVERCRLYKEMIESYRKQIGKNDSVDFAGYPVITFKDELLQLSVTKLEILLDETLQRIFDLA